MGIPLAIGFDVGSPIPLDSRDVVADITARNAIPAGQRYLGMAVHVLDSDGAGLAMNYQLVGGVADINWAEFAGGGGSSVIPQVITANYTQLASDSVLLVDASLGNVIIYLLPCATMFDLEKPLLIKKIDNSANTVALAPDGSETIDGDSSYVIYGQYDAITLISSPTFWSVF